MVGLGLVWAVGMIYLLSRCVFRVESVLVDVVGKASIEAKDYLAVVLEQHRNQAAQLVGQGVQQQLVTAKEELRVALADVVRAEAAQDLAEVATQAKTDFLSRMSHEIRTPINGIVGSLALLEPQELTAQQAEDLQRAVLSADRLTAVVNEVLDLAQIEADQVGIVSQSFDLKAVCEEAVNSFRPLADQKGLQLDCSLSAMAAKGYLSRRLGDQQKVHQVLSNLLSNAIKFTWRGSIGLVVNPRYGDQVDLVVADTGQGISKDQQDLVFQPFEKQEGQGTGLGLSICKEYVVAMGGEIRLASELGVGSTFTVSLEFPVDQAYYDNQAESGCEAESVEWDGLERPLRVLSADDDEVNRLVLQRHLEQMGCEVTSVENGLQAVEAFKPGHWDLIFMDLLMPVMDGFEAAAEIRRLASMGAGRSPVIVALTASVVGEIRDQCLEQGMDRFLTKPMVMGELKGLIQDFRDDYL